jgi:hypothetical protein
MLEEVKSDEQIYSKVANLIDVARAERVEARVEGFATKGNRARARLVVRLGGDVAEYSIRLHEGNAVKLRFRTTSRVEAERRVAVLRAI